MTHRVLAFKHITKQFFGVSVLKDICFHVESGSILGLVGENGAGKSTLMNILGGVIPPTEGSMELCGAEYSPSNPVDAFEHGIAFIHQELNLFANLSIADNLFIHDYPTKFGLPWIDKARITAQTQTLLEKVGLTISPDTLVEDLSPGERQLVEIAKALRLDTRLLLLDEPTTSLTKPEIRRLFSLLLQLRDQGIAMIYISHALEDVRSLCDRIVVLRDGEVVAQGKTIDFPIPALVSAMVGRELTQLYPDRVSSIRDTVVLDVRSISQPSVVHDISFQLHEGEIVGIAGLMGSGRTELARILFGLDSCAEGTIFLHGKRMDGHSVRSRIQQGLAFLTEDRRQEGLMMEATIVDNVALVALPDFTKARSPFLDARSLQTAITEVASSVQLANATVEEQTVKTLSGGNQQKVVLAKWLLQHPSVLILDEPTRGVDVGAKYEIYNVMNDITQHGNSVLFISSEIEELMGMCDRILVMKNGEIQKTFLKTDFDQEHILHAALGER